MKRKQKDDLDFSNFDGIKISLASPQTIRKWSYGEVKKGDTINYRTFRPERDGLFCEAIFGPTKDYECQCGKYKFRKHAGIICERCGVEVTESEVRRHRMGHIELAVPIAHVWFLRKTPSRIGVLLGMKVTDLEKVVYYANYVVTDPGTTPLKKKQLLSIDDYARLKKLYGTRFKAGIGAGAVRRLLKEVDLEARLKELRKKLKTETSAVGISRLDKHLKIVESFYYSGNKPEWMVMTVLPIMPPGLRPLVPLESGRFASSDLNDLYRRIINRNNRLRHIKELKAPEVVVNNEKRLLQEAIDALIENGIRGKTVLSSNGRPLKSLADIMKGKRGRFRQNLLGKRVDFSGRAVIVVGPQLRIDQCGVPKFMAVELFKPFIIKELRRQGLANQIRDANRVIREEPGLVFDILEKIMKVYPVLLNRAPTLHRLSIQAFYPVLVEGNAVQLHPLVCPPFNADFDGDQMALHVPLTPEARMEAMSLLISTKNLFTPASGNMLDSPSQDIVLGIAYLTKLKSGEKGEGKIFKDKNEAIVAYQFGAIDLHARIKVGGINKISEKDAHGKIIGPAGWTDFTTAGRIIFNSIIPEGIGWINEEMTKGKLHDLIMRVNGKHSRSELAKFLDRLKNLGFHYATISGCSICVEDLIQCEEKDRIIATAKTTIGKLEKSYRAGIMSKKERYNKIVSLWQDTSDRLADAVFSGMSRQEKEPYKPGEPRFNSLYIMASSGARGSRAQVRQLVAMRGMMARPQKKVTGEMGEVVETPVISNFREGLTVPEYFISTHGGRKGLSDTALKTSEAGYLSRKLIDVSQDVTITMDDCHSVNGITVSALREGQNIVEPLSERIVGRVVIDNIVSPITDEIIIKEGEVITPEIAKKIEQAGFTSVKIRSVLTCQAEKGVCAKCYGVDLSTGKLVQKGEAVGIIAAQSIGEPGTQLTLRTFHVGGIAGRIMESSELRAPGDGGIEFENLRTLKNRENKLIVISKNAKMIFRHSKKLVPQTYRIPYGAEISFETGRKVRRGELIAQWNPREMPLISTKSGTVRWKDIISGVTIREDLSKETGLLERIVLSYQMQKYKPQINIVSDKGKVESYPLPPDTHIIVSNGAKVEQGDIVAKIPQEITKIKDITGGLPRVTELFEARRPKKAAVISEISGAVEISQGEKGEMIVTVKPPNGNPRQYPIPHGKHLIVYTGDEVNVGDPLTDGAIDPHDILKVQGEKGVQTHLLDEVQGVYRLQGVKINDKHIEVVIKQMLSNVRIVDPGDTSFVRGEQVSKFEVGKVNEKLGKGKKKATFEPMLLGITKAALQSRSFISAASFQETTRVLSESAVKAAEDYLEGLKENIIVGRLIPAGTGFKE
ncbi:MAG: DNA-directed RNA polymerase subunit beta' [Elusimicrobia bacterium]|nr:DNA-directed RNA polymerase subunit beta' [Elusimicrobiota bacterium]